MKRGIRNIIGLMLLLLFISSSKFTNISYAANQKPTVSAHAYTIIDSKTGQVLDTYNGDKKIYPRGGRVIRISNEQLKKLSFIEEEVSLVRGR